jgi:hypothetical protein
LLERRRGVFVAEALSTARLPDTCFDVDGGQPAAAGVAKFNGSSPGTFRIGITRGDFAPDQWAKIPSTGWQ